MSTPTASWSSSISHHLCATRDILQGVIFTAKYVWGGETCRAGGLKTEFTGSRRPQTVQRLGKRARWARELRLTHAVFQFDTFEQGALEVLRLIRFWRNSAAPINRIPTEILVLLPTFWDKYDDGDEGVIALTHVCRTWREVFTSRPSLWTDLNCADLDKAEVYLERSKSLPINLSLDRDDSLSPSDPFLQIIPRVVGQLGSLSVCGTRKTSKSSPLTYLTPLPSLRNCQYTVVVTMRHIIIPCLYPGSSTGISPHYASCV